MSEPEMGACSTRVLRRGWRGGAPSGNSHRAPGFPVVGGAGFMISSQSAISQRNWVFTPCRAMSTRRVVAIAFGVMEF